MLRLVLIIASAATAVAVAPPQERRYDGRSLAEWRKQFQVLDPHSVAGRRAVPGLLAIVQDGEVEWFTRRQAALTLGRIGRPAKAAVPVLVGFLAADDCDETTLAWACKALALFGSEAASATPVLIHIAGDVKRPTVQRAAALEALAMIGTADGRVVPVLIELLSESGSDSAAIRGMTADALALIGPAAAPAIPALMRAAGDADELVRGKTLAALGAMRQHAEPALPLLLEALAVDESAAVRDAAGEALAAIGPAALPFLLKFLEEADAELRGRAASTLGRMGRQAVAAIRPLHTALGDSDPAVRLSAAEAVWRISSDAEAVLPVLLAGLTAEEREVRMRAYRLLVGMGPAAAPATPQLQKLAGDPRPSVRTAAVNALRELVEAERRIPQPGQGP